MEKILTISVNQPGNGGDRDTYEYTGGLNFDNGHAFITLEDTVTGEKKTTGFYPDYAAEGDRPKNVIANKSVPGKVVDDSNYDQSKVDVVRSYTVTDSQYKAAQMYVETIEKYTPKYNVETYNCTDYVLNTAISAGINLPDTQGSWPMGSGSNPGDLGEDIRKLNQIDKCSH